MRKNYWAKFEQENCYHVYNRCIDGLVLFKTLDNYHFFLQKWEQYLSNYCSLYAYCLIPNHFHFLIKCKTPNEKIMDFVKKEASNKAQQFLNKEITFNTFLESQFKRFFNSYVAAFNKENKRRGSLLKAKFKRILIRNPAHFSRMLCYIHHNPIHHNLKLDYISWSYNSYLNYWKVLYPTIPSIPNHPKVEVASSPIFELFTDINDKIGHNNFLKAHQHFLANYNAEDFVNGDYGDE